MPLQKKFNNKRQFLKLFSNNEKEITKFIDNNNISFKNNNDMIKLAEFCGRLN